MAIPEGMWYRFTTMADNGDIYKKPPGPERDFPEDGGTTPSTPPSPPHYKAIVILIGMALLLGAVAVYFAPEDAEEFETLPEPPPPRAAATNRTEVSPGRAAIDALMADFTASEQAPPTTLSPQKMAEAMGHVRAAQDYVRVRDMDSAEREVGKALSVWPDMNIAIRLLGSIYTQRGQFDQAIRLLERSLEIEPFSAETLNNLAINYLQKGMMGKAEELLVTALQIRPDYAVSFLNLGFLHLRMNRYDLAAENFELGLRQMPDNPAVLNNLAVCLMRLGNLEQAREKLQALLDLNPDRLNGYFNMAITYVMGDDLENAFIWLRRGAERASPSQLQSFLADPDFNPIRNHPEFEQLVRERFPDVPARSAPTP